MPRDVKIQSRRGTASEWTSVNPVLALGELGVEIDTHKIKAGDGVTSWNDLPYITGPVDGDNVSLQIKRDTETNLAASTTPIPDGTLVYNQTTGRMKIGDGETLWPNLPDPGKQFKNVVTVSKDGVKGSADFICSGYATDAACIQAAINYCKANSIGTLYIRGPDTYTITVQLIVDINLRIQGYNKPIFNWTVQDVDMIKCTGTVANIVSCSSDVTISATSVSVSDTTGIVTGDLAIVYDNTIWNQYDSEYADWKTGELHEVSYVSGNTIYFFDGLLHNYTVSNSASVKIIHPIQVEISDLIINGADATAQYNLIGLWYCKNSSVHDCVLTKGSEHGIMALDSYGSHFYKNKISRCENSGNGYGITVTNSSAHTHIHENTISSCRHCVASGGNFTIGQPRDIRVYNNEFYQTIGHMVDAHQIVESIYIYDNTFHGNGTGLFASGTGAKYTDFTHNTLYDCYGVIIRGSIKDTVYVINNNTSYRGGYLFSDNYTYQNTEKSVTVVNNRLYDATSYFYQSSKAANVYISGNYVDRTTDYYGIYLENSSGIISENQIKNTWRSGITILNCTDLKVVNNKITDCCQLNSAGELYEAGIAVRGTSNDIRIENNRITDSTGKMRRGIREYGTSDNNRIKNNKISGATIAQITQLGTNTKISQNDGYTTENTGTATITASQTSVTISHGLVAAPTRYSVTPSANIGNCWIDPITATEMTIHCSTAPASNTTVSWSAIV